MTVVDELQACNHESRTAEWPGFESIAKDLTCYDGPCEACADAKCDSGGTYKLDGYFIRGAQLAERYEFALDVVANNNSHGVDLGCNSPDSAEYWVWEFTRDDPEAIAQAQTNLARICAQLRVEGIPAVPGPAFAAEEWGQLFHASPDTFTLVRSHPQIAGVELVDVYRCLRCSFAGRWKYRDLVLRSQRLADLHHVQMEARRRRREGRTLPQPFDRPAPKAHRRLHLLLSLTGPDSATWAPAAARTFFGTATGILDPDEFAQIAGAPLGGCPASKVKGSPGTPAGVLVRRKAPRWRHPGDERQLTAASWPSWLDGLADLPGKAEVWLGRISEHGWANTSEEGALRLTSVLVAGGLSLEASFFGPRLSENGWEDRLLVTARSLAATLDLSYGEVGYAPSWTEAHGQTMLERLLYLDTADSIPVSRTRLRGYAWLTILSAEITAHLGGPDSLRSSGAFHRVESLPHGGVLLLATATLAEYGPGQAERVFAALAPALPPGRPARIPHGEPHLMVPRDPQTLEASPG